MFPSLSAGPGDAGGEMGAVIQPPRVLSPLPLQRRASPSEFSMKSTVTA